MEGLQMDSLNTMCAGEHLENLHVPRGSGYAKLMMAHLEPDHPSLSPPLYNGKDMVGNQIGLKESWQVLFYECL